MAEVSGSGIQCKLGSQQGGQQDKSRAMLHGADEELDNGSKPKLLSIFLAVLAFVSVVFFGSLLQIAIGTPSKDSSRESLTARSSVDALTYRPNAALGNPRNLILGENDSASEVRVGRTSENATDPSHNSSSKNQGQKEEFVKHLDNKRLPTTSLPMEIPLATLTQLQTDGLKYVSKYGNVTKVELSGRQILVNGKPMHMKGVCWNPVPKGGRQPENLNFRGFVAADSDLMSHAGINVLRTYEPIVDLEVLDELWKRQIYVLNSVYTNGNDAMQVVVDRVNAVKNHPAILMWLVGNEWNVNGLYVKMPLERAVAKIQEVVQLIKKHDTAHPVATIHGDLPSADTVKSLPQVDAWGINVYRGISFDDLFTSWADLSNAPMFVSEYGADAYDSRNSREDDEAQARATVALTTQINNASSLNGGVCSGGFIFEFADEYWKVPTGGFKAQDVGGTAAAIGPFPDKVFNEEYWGLCKMDGTPRKAFWSYASIPLPTSKQNDTTHSADRSHVSTPTSSSGDLAHARTLMVGNGIPWAYTLSASPRMKACGAHPRCGSMFGNCCPNDKGIQLQCCSDSDHAETRGVLPKQRLRSALRSSPSPWLIMLPIAALAASAWFFAARYGTDNLLRSFRDTFSRLIPSRLAKNDANAPDHASWSPLAVQVCETDHE